MEAKIMKMKKLLAVVLTGVMAMSVLTGCADIKTRQIADQLEGMLKSVNTKATVSATNDAEDLAKKAAKAVQKDDVDFGGTGAVVVDNSETQTPAKKTEQAAITEALKLSETKDKYVWVLRFDTKNLKTADQAKKIFDEVKSIDNALNKDNVENFKKTVTEGESSVEKTYKAMAGDKYEIGTETFSKGEGKDKVDYVMVVVTCKAVASTETVG